MEKKFDQGLKAKALKEIRDFGFYFSAGMALLFALSLWKHFALVFQVVVMSLFTYHLICALLIPKALKPTHVLTGFIGKIVGNTLTYIIFTVLYYVFFTPIALIIRLNKNDVIASASVKPAWIDIPEKDNDPKRVEKLF